MSSSQISSFWPSFPPSPEAQHTTPCSGLGPSQLDPFAEPQRADNQFACLQCLAVALAKYSAHPVWISGCHSQYSTGCSLILQWSLLNRASRSQGLALVSDSWCPSPAKCHLALCWGACRGAPLPPCQTGRAVQALLGSAAGYWSLLRAGFQAIGWSLRGTSLLFCSSLSLKCPDPLLLCRWLGCPYWPIAWFPGEWLASSYTRFCASGESPGQRVAHAQETGSSLLALFWVLGKTCSVAERWQWVRPTWNSILGREKYSPSHLQQKEKNEDQIGKGKVEKSSRGWQPRPAGASAQPFLSDSVRGLEGRLGGRLEGPLGGRLEGRLERRLEGRLEGPLEGPLEGRECEVREPGLILRVLQIVGGVEVFLGVEFILSILLEVILQLLNFIVFQEALLAGGLL